MIMANSGSSGGVYEPGTVDAPQRYCLAILVTNEPGVLARVVGLFSGRGYNIESLTVDEVDSDAHFSRITIVTNASRATVDQIAAQVARLVPVRQVVNLSERGAFVEACVSFIKLVANFNAHESAKTIARKYGAKIANVTDYAIIFELASERDKIERFIAELKPLGVLEIARTGNLAMGCGEDILSAKPDLVERQSA
jgi:acetolactate synthase-1/3 small subunit